MSLSLRRTSPANPASTTARPEVREAFPPVSNVGARIVTSAQVDTVAMPRTNRADATPSTAGGSLLQRMTHFLRTQDKAVSAVVLGASALLSLPSSVSAYPLVHVASPGAPIETRAPAWAEFQGKAADLSAKKGSMPYTELAAKRDALYREYAGRLGSVPAATADRDRDGVNAARETLFGSKDTAVDSDEDRLGDAFEIARGLDPADAQSTGGAKNASWTHGYIPMANNPMIRSLSLSAYDMWMKQETGVDPKVRYAEGRSGIDGGRYFLAGALDENDAEFTTARDFNGDGVLTPGVKADFLTPSAVEPRLEPDGKLGTKLDVIWWGQCNAVSAAGINFREPKESVTVRFRTPLVVEDVQTRYGAFTAESVQRGRAYTDIKLVSGQTIRLPNADVQSQQERSLESFTFTPSDLKELAATLAGRGAKSGTEYVGTRFYGRDAFVELTSGETVRGKVLSSLEGLGALEQNDGLVRLTNPTQAIVVQVLDFATGDVVRKTFTPRQVKSVTAENPRDVNPIDFHTTMLKWLGSDGTAGVMDKDAEHHVWNYAFDRYTYEATPRPNAQDTIDVTMNVFFPEGPSTTYRYSIQFDALGNPVAGKWATESPNPDFLWRERGGVEGFNHQNGPGKLDFDAVMKLLNRSYAQEDAAARMGPR
jgi:hypothetical protein